MPPVLPPRLNVSRPPPGVGTRGIRGGFTFLVDVKGWVAASAAVRAVLDDLVTVQSDVFIEIGGNIVLSLKQTMADKQIRASGTYESSLKFKVTAKKQRPELRIFQQPTGSESAKLNIYTKVLEYGARANPSNLAYPPKSVLANWAISKGKSKLFGWGVATKIRKFGVPAHPILQSIFIIDPGTFTPIGLTGKGQAIVEAAMNKRMPQLENLFITVSKTGQTSLRLRGGQPGGGQFARNPNQ